MLRKLVSSGCVLLCLAASAQAAVLQIEGLAVVDAGKGFTPATNNMQVNPGDRVRAGAGCTLIVYHNGYEAKICNGQMAMVVSEPPSAPAGTLSLKGMQAPQETPDLLVPGLLLGGGIGLVVLLSNNQTRPYSP
jgi:hypothetical protein